MAFKLTADMVSFAWVANMVAVGMCEQVFNLNLFMDSVANLGTEIRLVFYYHGDTRIMQTDKQRAFWFYQAAFYHILATLRETNKKLITV